MQKQDSQESRIVLREKISNSTFYAPLDFGGRTPILNWYTKAYGVIPDIHYVGTCNTEQILKKYKNKIILSNKTTERKEDKSFISYYREINFLIDDSGIILRIKEGECEEQNEKKPIGDVSIIYQEKNHDINNLVKDTLKYYREVKEKGSLSIICKNGSGQLYTRRFTIKSPTIDFNVNYNEGFKEISDLIIKKLSVKDSKGIVMLHGSPGGGKTTYIRYLINNVSKPIIYIPPDMAHELSSPHFIPFLMDNPNSILVVEDAENILMKREEEFNNQAVSNLLNLSDGLLSECLNIQLVATFNTKLSNVDPALLRKGRLIAKHEFKELEESRAKKLAKKLGVKLSGKNTLAEIYNALDMEFSDKRQTVGFKMEPKKPANITVKELSKLLRQE